MTNLLTVIIPTSPIPTHPSTAILDETIANIRKYTNALIVIMFDGVHKSLEHRTDSYMEYRSLVAKKYSHDQSISLAFFPSHEHQTGMTRVILDTLVDTPLVMFCEHDCSPIGDIPFSQICDMVLSQPWCDYVRFNIFDKIPEEHMYLMLDQNTTYNYCKNPNCTCSESIDVCKDYGSIQLTHTIQFSARPHIAKTRWYRNILSKYFPKNSKEMVEDRLHGVVIESYKDLKEDIFKMYIYTPPGNQLRSYHSDGRGSDEKIIEA